MIVYKTTNLITGKFYVGKDSKNDPTYLGSGTDFTKDKKLYGEKNFKKEILEYCTSLKQLAKREIYWIDKLNARKIGYNIAVGGGGGEILDWKQKIEMGINDKISQAHLGKSLSESHKHSISNGMNQYKNKEKDYSNITEEEKKKKKIGKYNPFYGKKHTGDLSRFSTRKGKTPTNALKVKCIETEKEYLSCNEASLDFSNPNTARRAISACCKGLRDNFQDLHFEFI